MAYYGIDMRERTRAEFPGRRARFAGRTRARPPRRRSAEERRRRYAPEPGARWARAGFALGLIGLFAFCGTVIVSIALQGHPPDLLVAAVVASGAAVVGAWLASLD